MTGLRLAPCSTCGGRGSITAPHGRSPCPECAGSFEENLAEIQALVGKVYPDYDPRTALALVDDEPDPFAPPVDRTQYDDARYYLDRADTLRWVLDALADDDLEHAVERIRLHEQDCRRWAEAARVPISDPFGVES